ncbi:MAG: ImmA/IrrE family metallo-endopeptidase [Bacteroidales bacterium]|nr:ImmA/IrrE family metallo-endopeptidase [Bacteroidales bacterium]
MEEKKVIFGKRLKSVREMRGLSMAELSKKMNGMVTPQAIYKYEAGKMMPSGQVLSAFCVALETIPDFLFRPFEVSMENIEFRKKAKMTVKEKNMIIGEVKDGIERYCAIEDALGLTSKFDIDFSHTVVDSEDKVCELAAQLRKEWELGLGGICGVVNLLESHGVKVQEIEAGEDFDGLSGFANGCPVIILNKNYTPERKRFTALHELGHIVMTFPEGATPRQKESYCHLFANEVLIPSEIFAKLVGGTIGWHIHLRQFVDIQMMYGVSIDALMYKAKRLNLIPESRYVTLMKRKNADPAFKREVERSRTANERPSRFESLVYKALSAGLISETKAAYYLNINKSGVEQNFA